MIKGSCLAILILLIGSSMILTASSQEQVSQTVYVYEGDFNGTLLSGVQVAGQDAAGNSFGGMTDSNGVVVVNGQPGTWLFVFIKDGYETLDLSYNVTETGEGAVYLEKASQSQEKRINMVYGRNKLENEEEKIGMIKSSCLAALILLIGSSMILSASAQEQVSQTIYVYEGDLNGTLLSGVQVTGQD